MMKKKYLIILSVIIILGTLVWFQEPVLKAAGGAFGLADVSNPAVQNGEVTATSTLNYMTPGAGTTTITANTSGTDQMDVSVFVVASSTITDLRWRYEFSHSTTSVAANQVWFPEPIELVANATTTRITRTAKEYSWVFASSTPHRLATSTTMNGTFDQETTGAFVFRIKDIAARWTRVIFYLPTAGAAQAQSTALGVIPSATSTNAGIQVFGTLKSPL